MDKLDSAKRFLAGAFDKLFSAQDLLIMAPQRELLRCVLPVKKEAKKEGLAFRAKHEAGHILASIVFECPVEKFHIKQISSATRDSLACLFGEKMNMLGYIKINNDNINPQQETVVYLSGMASTLAKKHSYFKKNLPQSVVRDINRDDHEDVSFPLGFLRNRFIELAGRQPTKKESALLFTRSLKGLKRIFDKPIFQNATTTISAYLLEKRKQEGSGRIQNDLLSSLTSAGIKKKELSVIKKELLGFSFNEIIKRVDQSNQP